MAENDPTAVPERDAGTPPAWARSIEAAAIAGVVFAALGLVGVAMMLDLTNRAGSGADAAEWLQDSTGQTRQVIALNLISISSIAFVWFIAVIRRRIGEREDRFFGTVFIGSGIAFVAVWLAGATAMTAPAVALTYFDGASVGSDTVSYAAGLGAAYLWIVLPRVAAVFVLSTATIIRRTGAMPAWLAALSYVIGVGMIVVPFVAGPIGFVFPAWVLVVSVTILIERRESSLRRS